MPWASGVRVLAKATEGSPQAKSPLMKGDPDKDATEKLDSIGPGSVAIDIPDSGATSSTKRRAPSWRLKYQDFTISRQSSKNSDDSPRGFR